MMRTSWFALSLSLLPGLAQSPTTHSVWVCATDGQGAPTADLAAKEWKVLVAGKEVPLKQVETPAQTVNVMQNWTLVFEPVRDPAYRIAAFQAAAQMLANLPEGDRVLIVARTKEGLTPLTPGLTTDRPAWAKALEALPLSLSSEFDGRPGLRAPGLESVKLTADAPAQQEAFVQSLRAFLKDLPKTVASSPYGKPEPRGVRPIDRLGLNSPSEVRGRLKVVTAEMASLDALLEALGAVPGPTHCIVFSRNDGDEFVHPSVKSAMAGTFTRTRGDEGGPRESAELANREMTLAQARTQRKALEKGITLHSVAGSGGPFMGNLGFVAESTGGAAFAFDGQMPSRLGPTLMAFGNRYRLTWEEGAGAAPSPQVLSITTTRDGVKVMAPRER